MILAARTGRVVPTLELARACIIYGGYQVTEAGAIKGLIYAPFVTFIGQEFGLRAQIMTSLMASSLAEVLRHSEFFMASVHPGIRWPDQSPPHRGGHLVLVTAATAKAVTFHNPSGHVPEAQVSVTLPVDTFETFFAGRGIAIHGSAG